MTPRVIIAIAFLMCVQCAPQGEAPDEIGDNSAWAVDPNGPGPNEPPVGRSLFDELF